MYSQFSNTDYKGFTAVRLSTLVQQMTLDVQSFSLTTIYVFVPL